MTENASKPMPPPPWRPAAILTGLAIFAALLLAPPPPGLSPEAWKVVAVGALMISYWVSDAAPVPVSAMIPIVAFPLLGIAPIGVTTANYGAPTIFLFLGGFILALAMEKAQLHKRIALNVLIRTGTRQDRVVGGFMLATFLCGMWVSNTATAVMMLPVAISVARLLGGEDASGRKFALALMLGVAYAASISGVTTLIGSPPNALLAGLMNQTYGYDIGFASWMAVGVPMGALMLLLCWMLLSRWSIRLERTEVEGAGALIRRQLDDLGPWSPAEIRVAAVFAATAGLWIFRSLLTPFVPGLSDALIAILSAMALFMIPAGRTKAEGALIDWKTAVQLPWGVLLLFGGGLSLAAAMTATGLDSWIGFQIAGVAYGLPLILVVLLVVVVIMFVTELISNTATAAAFVPLVAALAVSLGENPLILAVPATIAASLAFMLPVATPPNALVFGTGYIELRDMVRNGFWLNLIGIVLVTLMAYALVLLVFGAVPGALPDWAIAVTQE